MLLGTNEKGKDCSCSEALCQVDKLSVVLVDFFCFVLFFNLTLVGIIWKEGTATGRAGRGWGEPLGWRDGSVVESTDCSPRGPEFNSQQPNAGSPPSVMGSDGLFWCV